MMVLKGSTTTLVQVTAVNTGTRRLTFGSDSLSLNQSAVGVVGNLATLNAQAPTGAAAPAATRITRVRMITYYLDNTTTPGRPRLVRRINNGHETIPGAGAPAFDNTLGTAVALDIENLRFTYDLTDGATNPGAVRFIAADLTTGGACAPGACFPTQIRKVNVLLDRTIGKREEPGERAVAGVSKHAQLAGGAARHGPGQRVPMMMSTRHTNMRAVSRKADESGIALITALLVLMLISGLMAGMFAAINLEQRSHAVDRDQTQVYAAAHAGLEKLTADLAGLFVQDFSPRVAQLNALTTPDRLPDISGFEYTAPGGAVGSGYAVSWKPDTDPTNLGNPMPLANTTIAAGPYVGFKGLLTRYDITVTARSTKGSEVRLRRGLQTVAVPVFQFGVFSETDLTFYGGDDFDFGGRVHTNANLWLSEAASKTLLFTDRITAYGDVSRKYLSNGLDAAANGMSGAVKMLAAIGNLGSARTMNYSPNEGSVTNNVGGFWTTATPPVWNANGALTNNGTPSWTTVSHTYYADNIINRNTGATVLRLPLVSQGATPIDLIRRPLVNSAENTANPLVFGQRYFGPMAGIRILLSDRAADITNLPTVTATAPMWLGGDWNSVAVPPVGRPAGYVVDATHPPIARAIGADHYRDGPPAAHVRGPLCDRFT